MNVQSLIIQIPVLLLALTAHEFAHGYVAYKLGDPTAKSLGRLTMNPLKHLDPIGTIALFIISFGWAKPVPVNPSNLRNPKIDMLKVALAGPMTNLGLALVSAVLYQAIIAALTNGYIPLTETSRVVIQPIMQCLEFSVGINLILCIFNFLPIPPLDGSRILAGLLPNHLAFQYLKYEKYSFIIILILVFTGTIGKVIIPTRDFLMKLLLT